MAATVTKPKLSVVELMDPPIPSHEPVLTLGRSAVGQLLTSSAFYMTAGRAEAKFTDIIVDQDAHVIRLNMSVGDVRDPVQIRLPSMMTPAYVDECWIEADENFIGIYDGTVGTVEFEVVEWFTPEKLLNDRSRRMDGIEGLQRYPELATYDLFTVGIAQAGDSFESLMAQAHKARMEILANEPQRYPAARVTDEIFLFMFRVTPLFPVRRSSMEERIVAHAEKAFASFLKPQHDIAKLSSHPKDSHQGPGDARYIFLLGEDLAFNTAHGPVRGARDPDDGISDDADFIVVEGDGVSFFANRDGKTLMRGSMT